MLTLHYTSNASLSLQTATFPQHAHPLDFADKNDVRRATYWTNKFLARHGVGKKRPDVVAYLQAERDWIRALFEREPGLPLAELPARYNEYWEGRVVGGRRRPARTAGALVNEVYRSNLKRKAA